MVARWKQIAVFVAAVGAVAGCGSALPAGGGSGSSPSSAEKQDLHGAPHVAHPLGVAKFVKSPCDALTGAQVQQLHTEIEMGTHPKLDRTESVADGCIWKGEATDPKGNVAFLQGQGGLSYMYAQRQQSAVFEPIAPIEGYPALHTSLTEEHGECSLAVGVADKQAISVFYHLGSGSANSCDAARKIATAVVQTVKSGG